MKSKKIQVSLLSLMFMGQLSAAEYIVKLKPHQKGNFLRNKANSFEEVRDLKVGIGEFVVVNTNQKSALENVKNLPEVEYIEPNYTWHMLPYSESSELTMDPSYKDQWGMKNTGTNSRTGSIFRTRPGIEGKDINVENAWEVTMGNRAIKIAVIDTGIDYNHPDLKTQLWVNEAEMNGEKGVDDDGNGVVDDIYGANFSGGGFPVAPESIGNPMDGQGHGTHCAGVIGAAHNGIGVQGVLKNTQIMAIKFLSDSGQGDTEGAIKAIDYAIKMGADVMSNSWGGGPESQALKDAISVANEKGIVFVAAAGNNTSDNDAKPSFPASYDVPNVISVGAYDGAGKVASFSNYGKKSVHVFAPGVDILSTYKGSIYKKLSGTSMAAPFVSGMVGLLLAQEGKSLQMDEVRERFIKTSILENDLRNSSVSAGRVDASRLLSDLRN